MKNILDKQLTFTFVIALAFVNQLSGQELQLKEQFEEYRNHNYQEKVYVSTDRNFYIAGEIIWFHTWMVDASFHKPSQLSKIVYVELIGSDSTAYLRGKIALENGVGSGSFYIPTTLNAGSYVLRAYTSWMKNYDASYYFKKEISIVNTFKNLKSVSNTPKIEISFYPEGGQLVSEVPGKVAFQALSTNGSGVDFSGSLIDNSGDTVLSFKPLIFGMGSFEFIPEKGQRYRAVIESGGNKYYARLPEVLEEGYGLALDKSGSQLELVVLTTKSDNEMFLLSHGRNVVTHALRSYVSNGRANFMIETEKLREGINHFTVFNASKQPVAERLYYKSPESIVPLGIKTDQSTYATRSKVSTYLNADGENEMSLTMSVFKLDSLNQAPSENIVNYLYLLSDLKGVVENPSYYFTEQATDEEKDLLMLTHGWSRFKWEEVLDGIKSFKKYAPELRGHIVQGKVVDETTNKIAEDVYTYLTATGEYPRFYVSRSDNLGRIRFEVQDFYGPSDIIVSTDYTKDSTYRLEIDDPFSLEYDEFSTKDILIDQELRETILQRSVGMQALNIYQGKKVDSYIPPPADTSIFFIEGDARYLLDDYKRFTIMEDVMREYVPNVWVRTKKGDFYYRIMDVDRELVYKNPPLVLYDGMPVFDINRIMEVDPLKVERLDVFSKRYFYGQTTYDGIVSYYSYDRNLDGIQVDPRCLVMEYDFAQIEREFYSPDYSKPANETKPDFRNLLYWSADIDTNKDGEVSADFYTTDEPGKYLIVVEGITSDGKPGFASYHFNVEKEPN